MVDAIFPAASVNRCFRRKRKTAGQYVLEYMTISQLKETMRFIKMCLKNNERYRLLDLSNYRILCKTLRRWIYESRRNIKYAANI